MSLNINQICKMENDLRNGDCSAAIAFVKGVSYVGLDPKLTAKVLEIGRRVGLSQLSLSRYSRKKGIEKNFVNNEEHRDLESIEYAACLMKSGYFWESFEILHKIDDTEFPIVNLYLGYWHILKWDYQRAKRFLLKFISSNNESSYLVATAKINLLACYIHLNEFNLVTTLSGELERTLNPNWKTLSGNLFTLIAEYGFFISDNLLMEKSIQKAYEYLGSKNLRSNTLAEKWNLIIQLSKNTSIKNIEILKNFGRTQSKQGFWEIQRDCEFYLAKYTEDRELFLRLYFGTPFESFKLRVNSIANFTSNEKLSYLWFPKRYNLNSFKELSENTKIIDVYSGSVVNGCAKLKKNSLPHQLLSALSKDFYRPQSLGEIFNDLYGPEYFDILNSEKRIRRMVDRLRQWLDESHLGCNIEVDKNRFYFEAIKENILFRISGESQIMRSEQEVIDNLSCHFKDYLFSIANIVEYLKCTDYQARRAISWAASKEIVQKTGSGKNTRYFFSS